MPLILDTLTFPLTNARSHRTFITFILPAYFIKCEDYEQS